jgi:hypothetical protein
LARAAGVNVSLIREVSEPKACRAVERA